jgi:hypothetical protein
MKKLFARGHATSAGQVSALEHEAGVIQGTCEVHPTSGSKIVDAEDFCAVSKQRVNQMRSQETRGPGHYYFGQGVSQAWAASTLNDLLQTAGLLEDLAGAMFFDRVPNL